MLDHIGDGGMEELDAVTRKLIDNTSHFINTFQLEGTLSQDQINRLRDRLLYAGENKVKLAGVQRDIIAFRDFLIGRPLTEEQVENMEEGMRQTHFYEAVKSTGLTDKDIYAGACIMLQEAIDIIREKPLQDIASVAQGIRDHVVVLLQSRNS